MSTIVQWAMWASMNPENMKAMPLSSGEPPEAELPPVQVREGARHCVVQEMVVLKDEVRDVLSGSRSPRTRRLNG